MAIARVAQSIKSGDGSNYDHSKASDALNVPAGALIVVKFSSPQSGNIATAPTDTAGNTYVGSSSSRSSEQAIWYCLNATANAANVVTAAFSNGCSEYGYSVEVYTGGTWTYDAANSGQAGDTYGTAPIVTPALATSGQGVIATCFGQYDWPRAGNSATQTPGSVVNSGGDGTTVVMASGEVINSGAFSGTISVNIQQPTPANTKCDLLYASFLVSGGSSGVTGTLNATLGAATASAAGTVTTHGTLSGTLAAMVMAAAGAVAIAGSGGGTLGATTSAATGTVATHAALTQTLGAVTGSGAGAVKVTGSLSQTLGAASVTASGTVVSGRVGSLDVTLGAATVSASGGVRVTGTASNVLGAATSAATGAVRVAGQLAATLGSATVTATGTATPGIHGSLDATLAPASVSAAGNVATHGSLVQTLGAASAVGTGTLAIRGSAALALDPFTGSASGDVPIAGNLNAALAPATIVATGRLPGASLPVDPLYVIQLPARPFYAAAPARPFYALSTPNMTQTFNAKDPRETVVLTFDASFELAAGETLADVAKTDVAMMWGADSEAGNVVSDAQINGEALTVNGVTVATGHAVQAIAEAGLDRCGYHIAITCNTSNPDKVLTLKAILPVSAQ